METVQCCPQKLDCVWTTDCLVIMRYKKNRIVATSIIVVWDVCQKPVLPEVISVVNNKINTKFSVQIQ